MNRKYIEMVGLLFATVFLWHCGGKLRPAELTKADQLIRDQTAMAQVAKAAPQQVKESQKYYKRAEKAFKSRDKDECIYYATMAAIKFSTAMEIAKKQAAEKKLKEAAKRLKLAQKAKKKYEARKADADKRIARMEKILALQKGTSVLEAQRKAAAEKLTAEKNRREVTGLLASAKSNIQTAETLDASKHDSINFNSAKTFVMQAEKALEENRVKDASDLAKMAVDKAALATVTAKKMFAKERKKTDLLREREQLFSDAAGIRGLKVRQEKRGMVLSLYDMFAGGKVIVLPERTYLLDKIAELSRKYPDYPLAVEGYTDSWGREVDNLALAQSRAQSVLDYLVQQQKVGFNRIKSSGYGEANPVADNSTRAGRAKNRRVEVIFIFR